MLIAFNTLVNNKTNITQGGRKEGMGATYITVANNIIKGGNAAASISGPFTNGVWLHDIIFNVKSACDLPAAGANIVDPKLEKDATGIYHLQKGSPAIDNASGSYGSVIFDMDGQKRLGKFDVGADEINNGKAFAHALIPADVGHIATHQ